MTKPTKPIDNEKLKAELWEYAVTPQADESPSVTQWRDRIKQIPQEIRKELEAMWWKERARTRYAKNDDGTIGLFVTDHLFCMQPDMPPDDEEAEEVDVPLSPIEFGKEVGWSTNYVHALCNALGIDANTPA